MIKPFDLPIIGDSNEVPQDDPQYTLNLYAEKVSEDVLTLKPTPGTETVYQFSISGGGRGLIACNGRLFGVRGGFFQEIVDGSPVVRGTLSSNSGKVGMIACVPPIEQDGPPRYKISILIVDASKGYVFELTDNSFTTLTGDGGNNFLGGNSQVAFCAGRAWVLVPGTTQFQCSNQYDFKTWNVFATATAESLTTNLEALASNGDLLYVFSSDGFEVWQNQGIAIMPLSRILSGDKIGILAPNSALFIERYVYWLGKTSTGEGVVYRHQGGGVPERISNHSTERQIAALTGPSDAIGDSYTSLGHVFYLLGFQTGNKTLVWDKTTNLWHDRAQREPLTGTLFALPYFSMVVLDGDILAININNGKVVRLDNELYTDDGDPIRRERITSVFPPEADYLTFFQSVELFGQIGNTPVGQDDPQLMLRYSADRGMTWSSEMWQQAGGNSTYAARTKWTGLGAAYGLAFWFAVVASQYISWRSVRVRAE